MGGAILASIIESLSICFTDETYRRNMWSSLAKNRKAYIRRRFARLLRENLIQKEADTLWEIYCLKRDSEILRNLILASSSISLPKEAIDSIAEDEGQGYLLSRAIAHEIYHVGRNAFKYYYRPFPVSTIYAGGFSGRNDLVSDMRVLVNRKKISIEERKAALWALARLKDKEGVFKVLGSVFSRNE